MSEEATFSTDEPTFEEYALGLVSQQNPMALPYLIEARSRGKITAEAFNKATLSQAADWETACRTAMQRGTSRPAAQQLAKQIADKFGLDVFDLMPNRRPGSLDDLPTAFRDLSWLAQDDDDDEEETEE